MLQAIKYNENTKIREMNRIPRSAMGILIRKISTGNNKKANKEYKVICKQQFTCLFSSDRYNELPTLLNRQKLPMGLVAGNQIRS